MAKGDKVTEKTIRELCNRVASNCAHLLPNDEEAIVVYQDLIGHATVEENRELANDPALMETFYRIYGVAFGTVAAIKFYMANSNKIAELNYDLDMAKQAAENLHDANKKLHEEIAEVNKELNAANGKINGYVRSLDSAHEMLDAKDQEIIALKAKLYDLQNEIEVMRKG